MEGRRLLLSSQKNEGPFLLEWLAYHFATGFSHAVIFSNDCDDGSDVLLDVLAERLPVEHVRHVLEPGEAPQGLAARKAIEGGYLHPGDWVIWLDTDEFLNVHEGGGQVTDLIALAEKRGADGVCVGWRMFGSGGLKTWPGRQLDRAFVRAGSRFSMSARMIKTLFRMSDDIGRLDPHRPYLSRRFLEEKRFYLDGRGHRLPDRFYLSERPTGAPTFKLPGLPSYRLAQVNHYAIRTPDAFALRQARGRGLVAVGGTPRHTSKHFRRYDRNFFRDGTILHHVPAVDALLREWLSDSAIAAAHREAASRLPTVIAPGL